MYCDSCGKEIAVGTRFCPACGKALGGSGATPVSSQGRVSKHVQIVAVLWLAASGLRLAGGLIGLVAGSVILPGILSGMGWPLNRLVPGIVSGFAMGLAVYAIAGLAAGWGLLQRESWARGLTLVLAVLSLLHFPLGTALGIYTLWVLLPQESAREWGSMAAR